MNSNLKPTAKFEIITPIDANNLLAKNKQNRPLDARRVVRYCREITLNRWAINGDTIKVDTEGELLDGQHRLEALVRSGVPLECLIVRGLNKEVFSTIDVGKTRSGGDVLAIKGFQYASHLSAAARHVFIFRNASENASGIPKANGRVITSTDILDIIERNPGLVEMSGDFCRRFRKLSKIIGYGSGMALNYLFTEKDATLAAEYMWGLESGANLDSNSITYQVREKLLSLVGTKHTYFETGFKLAIIIKGWNLMRDGTHDVRLVIDNTLTLDQIK